MDNEKLYNLYYDALSSMSSNLRFWYVMQEHLLIKRGKSKILKKEKKTSETNE